jgi:hypothetical protein
MSHTPLAVGKSMVTEEMLTVETLVETLLRNALIASGPSLVRPLSGLRNLTCEENCTVEKSWASNARKYVSMMWRYVSLSSA